MDLKDALILNADDPISKALDEILRPGSAVIVMKNRSYLGIIDDRNIRLSISDVSRTKCENACVKSPILYPDSPIIERIKSFLTGHFKALPVFDRIKKKPIGITTRVELLKDLLSLSLVPDKMVSDLMNKPVYTVDINSSLADAKNKMKEFRTNRLVVVDKSYPYGIISTFDLLTILINPKGRRGLSLITEVEKKGIKPISDLVREDLILIEKDKTIRNAMKKMINSDTSHVLVVSNRKPVGVLAAVDVFKEISELVKDRIKFSISGLRGENQRHYDVIRESILSTLRKFSKSFNIRNVRVHIKEGKSVYTAKLSVNLRRDKISISSEDYNLGDTIDGLAYELYNILKKRKSIKKNRKKSRVGE